MKYTVSSQVLFPHEEAGRSDSSVEQTNGKWNVKFWCKI